MVGLRNIPFLLVFLVLFMYGCSQEDLVGKSYDPISCAAPGSGDWIITAECNVTDEVIYLPTDADVVVNNGGYLRLMNTTLWLNGTVDGASGITVASGGILNISQSSIDTVSTKIFFLVTGSLSMTDSFLNNTGWSAANHGLVVNSPVFLSGNTVSNAYTGIVLNGDNNYLFNNTFREIQQMGINAAGTDNSRFFGNTVYNAGKTGTFHGIYFAGNAHNNSIINNTVYNNTYSGIYFSGSPNENNSIWGNLVFQNGQHGIALSGTSSGSDRNSFFNNTVFNNALDGFYVRTGSDYNVFIDNVAYGNYRDGFNVYEDSVGNRIEKNTVYDNLQMGILLTTNVNDTLVKNNVLFNNNESIVTTNSFNNKIIDTRLENNSQNDAHFYGPGGNTTFINVSFSQSEVTFQDGNEHLLVQWYLDVYVRNSTGSDIDQATVNVYDNQNNLIFSQLTQPTGFIVQQNVTEYMQNVTAKYYKTLITVNASKTGYANYTTTINLTAPTTLVITLDENASSNPCLPSAGDWNISSVVTCSDMTITLNPDQDLNVVSGGSLIFSNITLLINGTANGNAGIRVFSGGALNVSASVINSTNGNRFFFTADAGSTFSMEGSALTGAGWSIISPTYYGLIVYASNSLIKNNIFTGNNKAITLASVNNTVTGNQIFFSDDTGIETFSAGAVNNLIANNTFNDSIGNRAIRLFSANNTVSSNYIFLDTITVERADNTISYNTFVNGSLELEANNNLVQFNTFNAGINTALHIGTISPASGNIVQYNAFTSGDPFGTVILYDIATRNVIRHNTLSPSGIGFAVFGVNNTFNNISVTSGTYAFDFQSPANDNKVIDSVLTSGVSHGSNLINTLLNTTYGSAAVTDGTLNVQWYVDVHVQNATADIDQATVTGYDVTDGLAFSALTQPTGFIARQNVTEYAITSSGRQYKTNYTFNVSKSGYIPASVSFNFTNNSVATITLIPNPGNSPPDVPVITMVSLDGSNTTASDLNCSAVLTDADGDLLNVNINWVNGVVVQYVAFAWNNYSSGTLFSTTLDKINLTANDTWTCALNVYDGVDYSGWGASNNITIIEPPAPFCGDLSCNNGEDCNSCSADCGQCEQNEGGGGGGGGGGAGAPPKATIRTSIFEFNEYLYKATVTYNATKNINVTLRKVQPEIDAELIYGGFFLNGTLNISLGTIDFKISKDWLSEQNADADSLAIKQKLTNWKILPLTKTKEDSSYVYYSVPVTQLGTFAVTALKEQIVLEEQQPDVVIPDSPDEFTDESLEDVLEKGNNGFNLFIYVGIIMLLLIGMGGFFYYRAKHVIAKEKTGMIDEKLGELRQYVEVELDKGVPKDDIKKSLCSVGWHEDIVDRVVQETIDANKLEGGSHETADGHSTGTI
ncbi:PGF-pre-PGF domain-containing protein [Candidatus Woesearchaeota archaeon]|nr:MAG: PGF-pre-PGF domain-containing protein [Candidatus Woesearchaeota archaeon]